MHDALHPVQTIKSYPCENGKKCEISVFDETYSFVDAATQTSFPVTVPPTPPTYPYVSEAFKKKNSAFCIVEGDLR